jgi:hypothetical protein
MSKTPTRTTPTENDPLQLTPDETWSLRRVVAYALPEERRHWQEAGRPKRHIYRDLKALSLALRRPPDKDSITLTWITDDVLSVRPDLSREQARAVLRYVLDHLDANYGVTWDTLEIAADALYGRGEPA